MSDIRDLGEDLGVGLLEALPTSPQDSCTSHTAVLMLHGTSIHLVEELDTSSCLDSESQTFVVQ